MRRFPKGKVTLIVLANRPGGCMPVTWSLSALLLPDEDPKVPAPHEFASANAGPRSTMRPPIA